MIWSPFGSKKGATADGLPALVSMSVSWDRDGARFRPEPVFEGWLSSPMSFGDDSELALLLRQLEEEGFAELEEGIARLSWEDFYKLQGSSEHGNALGLLGLPPQEAWKPILSSGSTLTDAHFSVSIQGWLDPQGRRPNGNVDIIGAVLTAGGKSVILPEAAWRMVVAVAEQRRRKPDERVPDVN